MARLFSSGFELNSLTAGVEFDAVGAEQTIDTVTIRSGTYSLKCSTTASGTNFVWQQFGLGNQTGIFYFRQYIYLTQAPSSNQMDILSITATNSLTFLAEIQMSTGRALTLYDSVNGVQIGSASAPLSLNTWYRIEIKVDTTILGSTTLDVRKDGVSFASGTVDWSLVAGQAGVTFGNRDFLTGSYAFYLDDLAINDTTDVSQNSWPGDEKIIHLLPNALGDNNDFVTQTGGTTGAINNYTRVNEVTPDDATTFNGDHLVAHTDMFNMTNSGIGTTDTVNVVQVGVRFRNNIADTITKLKVQIEKASAGTAPAGIGIIPNSTAWATNSKNAPHNYSLTLYQDPDAINWTQATLDTMQAGYVISTGGTNRIDVSALWVLVGYTPSTGPAITGPFPTHLRV